MVQDLGTLHVRLCNARGLPKMDVFGTTDPFVELKVGSRDAACVATFFRFTTPVLCCFLYTKAQMYNVCNVG
jgi:Ca2+-dependent lipid-binding protein